MLAPNWRGPLDEAYQRAIDYLPGVPMRPVGARATAAQLRAALGGPLPAHPTDPRTMIAELAAAVGLGLVATSSGRSLR